MDNVYVIVCKLGYLGSIYIEEGGIYVEVFMFEDEE